ncbi:MAG: DNA polymerase III subunit epsilon [Actinobacteria bacterium HGW-Actinobacteria-7]|nr:MAG: DNA polymerase III subunit epsilon [Actinobacteria bacterium HGW-Actinobacteria-7]
MAAVTSDALSSLILPGTDPDIVDAYATFAERAREATFGFEEEVCVLDIETTGYDASRDRIIEVAAAIMRGPEVLERFSSLVDPMVPVPTEITKLTGIDDQTVQGAPCAEAAVARLAEFAGGREVVAHNGAFDRGFLEAVAGRGVVATTWLDSLVFTRIGLPRVRSHRLTDLAAAFAPELTDSAHRAAHDVEALTRIWRVALTGVAELEPGLISRIAGLAPSAPWPERPWLARIAAAHPRAAYDLKEVRRRRVAADKGETLRDADDIECTCPASEEVAAEFATGGLAGRMYPGFEKRSEQVEMARAVLASFETSTHVAIEAGTGVGKSMAYLVPAALFSLENRVGVGVATKTNALMDQLVYHELPRLNEALGGELRYVALKGYDHYPCLRKLERAAGELHDGSDPELISAIAMLIAWVGQSAWGDLDAVNLHWRRELRASVQASQADCTHKRCRYYPNLCYLHGVRRRAASSNIVVTNHALLFRDVVAQGGILPPVRHWIIDEAHSAESEARKQLTLGASQLELSVVLGALHTKRGGLLESVRKKLAGDQHAGALLGLITQMEEGTQRCATLAQSLFEFVKDLAPLAGDSDYDAAELWLTDQVRESGPWGTVASTGRSLARRLAELLAEGRELVTRLEEYGPEASDPRADLVGLLTRLADQHLGLVAVVDGENDALVYSATLDRRAGINAEKLVAERLDIGEVLAEDLYPRAHSVVFTSATIAAGESFEHFARSVGLDRLDRAKWRALRLESSYEFERQMAVFVPTDLPEPREAGYLSRLEALLEGVHVAMGGSVLTLFTNRRDMERLHALLEPRLRTKGLDLICQRRGTSAKRLRDEFLADEHLSLFALKSFWEGFDAKGDTLRCVVVPKLPFGRPTDPLSCERERREGRAAWNRYSLPEAVLELKQAAGRLIRSSTDTGCLVIADARVVRKGYGARFLEALPVADVERMVSTQVVEAIGERFGR